MKNTPKTPYIITLAVFFTVALLQPSQSLASSFCEETIEYSKSRQTFMLALDQIVTRLMKKVAEADPAQSKRLLEQSTIVVETVLKEPNDYFSVVELTNHLFRDREITAAQEVAVYAARTLTVSKADAYLKNLILKEAGFGKEERARLLSVINP